VLGFSDRRIPISDNANSNVTMRGFIIWIPTWAVVLILILTLGIVVVAICTVSQMLNQRRVRRTLSVLSNTACPTCLRALGSTIGSTVRFTHYMWDPLSGEPPRQVDLPDKTLQITCPHCACEVQYCFDGTLFTGPPEGYAGVEIREL